MNLAADVLHMRINSHVISNTESYVFAVVENDITLCPTERHVQLKVCVHLFGRIR